MSSKGLHAKFRNLYVKCKRELELWDALQAEGSAQLGACVSIIYKLPALQNEKCYGALAELPGMQARLLGKQMVALETLMSDLRTTLKECGGVRQRLEKSALDAARQLRAEKLSPAAQAASLGAQPSLAQCVAGLHTIWQMIHDEVTLKLAILDNVTYESRPKDLEALLHLFRAEPNIDKALMRDTIHRVLAAD